MLGENYKRRQRKIETKYLLLHLDTVATQLWMSFYSVCRGKTWLIQRRLGQVSVVDNGEKKERIGTSPLK